MGVVKWFKPVSVFDLAFALHRLTGIVLLLYLCMHLAYLSTLREPEVYESLIAITTSPQFLPLDALLVLCGVYHGVNGVRVIIHELGFLHEHRRALLALTVVTTLVVWILAVQMMLEAV
ncbi:MAG: succinate dehydrogenase [Archaeoglobaceae archaeon]